MNPNVSSVKFEGYEEMSFANFERLIIKQHKVSKVRKILDTTPSLLKIVDASSQTLLHLATKHKNLAIMEYLLEKGCNIEAKTNDGLTPLMIAAKHGSKNAKFAELLLDNGADIFATNLEGVSALQLYLYSIGLTYEPVIEKFFEKAKDTNDEDLFNILQKGNCHLRVVVHLRRPELLKMFLDQEPSSKDIGFLIECTYARDISMQFNYEENWKVFLNYDFKHDKSSKHHFIILFRAVQNESKIEEVVLKNFEMFVRLFKELKLNGKEADGFYKIFSELNEKSLGELLKTDLISLIKNQFVYNPIAYVFGNPEPNILKLIHREKFDVHLRGVAGETTLHMAFKRKIAKHVEYLLEKDVDPNMPDKYGITPIFYTFLHIPHPDSNACLKLLLRCNVDIQICNKVGKTFIEYCRPIIDARVEQPLKTIFAHLAILRSCDIPIKAPFINFINSQNFLTELYEKACQQLEQMKTHKIHGPLTLFGIITQSYKVITKSVKTMDLDTINSLCSDLIEYNDYYVDIIRCRLIVACKINEMKKKAATVVYDCIDQLKGQMLAVHEICSYLSYEHLHKIVYPSHEKHCKECRVPDANHYNFVKVSHESM